MKTRNKTTMILAMLFTAAMVFGLTTLNAAAEEKATDEAAELAIALTVILAYYRHRENINSDRMTLLRG